MILDEKGLHLHQSDIETYMQCPEQLRLKFLAGINDESFTSDAAFVGTSTHAVIEHELVSDVPYANLAEVQNYAAYAFLEGMEEMAQKGTVYSRESFKTDSAAIKALMPLAESWYISKERDMLMSMDRADYQVEYEFDRAFTVAPSGLVVFLAGRQDLIFQNRIWDWKTASSMNSHKRWEKQRWGVQPTVYTWAAATEGFILPRADGTFLFEEKVLLRKAKPVPFETVSVTRTVGTFTWLERITQNIVTLMEGLGIHNEWPLVDHSALCGPKWCPFWDNCKGAYIDADTWT